MKQQRAISLLDPRRSREEQKGAIEIIATLLLSGVLFTLLCGFWINSTEAVKKVRDEIRGVRARIRIESLLEMIVRDVDRHRLPFLPIIHREGQILLSDGQQHPVALREDLLGPSERSTPISYFEVAASLPLRVKQVYSFNGRELMVLACSPESGDSLRPSTENYLAVFGDRAALLSGSLIGGEVEERCRRVVLEEVASPVLPRTSPTQIELARALVPLQRAYTWYVDRKKTLRVITLRGKEWSSPQPVVSGVEDLHFEARRDSQEELYGLQGLFAGGRRKTSVVFTRLSRKPVLNLILNWER